MPTLCAHKFTTALHTCRHTFSICLTVNTNVSCRLCMVGNLCQAFERVFAVSMRQLLQHFCLTYSLDTVLQADSAALSTHGCDINYCYCVRSFHQTTFPRPHVTPYIKMCSVRFSARPHVTPDIKMCSFRFSARLHVTPDIKMCSVRFSEGARHFSLPLNFHTGCGDQLVSCWKGDGFLSQR